MRTTLVRAEPLPVLKLSPSDGELALRPLLAVDGAQSFLLNSAQFGSGDGKLLGAGSGFEWWCSLFCHLARRAGNRRVEVLV